MNSLPASYKHKYRAKGENLTICIEILCVRLVGPPPAGTETQPFLHPRCHDNGNVDDLMEDCSRVSLHTHTIYIRVYRMSFIRYIREASAIHSRLPGLGVLMCVKKKIIWQRKNLCIKCVRLFKISLFTLYSLYYTYTKDFLRQPSFVVFLYF